MNTFFFSLVDVAPVSRRIGSRVPLSDQFFNPELVYKPGGLDRVRLARPRSQARVWQHHLWPADQSPVPRQKQELQQSTWIWLPWTSNEEGTSACLATTASGSSVGWTGCHTLTTWSTSSPMRLWSHSRLSTMTWTISTVIGGISERHVSGSLLGPTFQCIVGDQFKRLHHGDRSAIVHNFLLFFIPFRGFSTSTLPTWQPSQGSSWKSWGGQAWPGWPVTTETTYTTCSHLPSGNLATCDCIDVYGDSNLNTFPFQKPFGSLWFSDRTHG